MGLIGRCATLDEARLRLAQTGMPPDQRREAEARLTPATFARVKALLSAVDHSEVETTPERIADAFDRAAAISPEGGVALYSLGDPALLEAITREVARWIDGLGVLGPDRRLLEVGCGIGRFLGALAPRLELAVGLDVSSAMVREAARRCAPVRNVGVLRSSGRDLACIRDASVDVVLFADSFPYLVQVGRGLPERHFLDVARVLRPGGSLLILNYSYRGDAARDLADADALGRRAGLTPTPVDLPRFEGWDATPFVFALT